MDGTVVTGEGVGGQFVAEARESLWRAAGFRPYDGTFNLTGVDVGGLDAVQLDEVGNGYCDGVILRACRLGGVRTAAIRPIVPEYPDGKTELLAPVHLRTLFDLEDGSRVPLRRPDDVWPPTELSADTAALDAFDGIVFDLDGTLLDLAVDWPAAYDEIDQIIGDHLDAPITDHRHDEVFRIAAEQGRWDEVHGVLTDREVAGAAGATPRSTLAALSRLDAPVGVCTINATEAAERALEAVGAGSEVAAVVGRDSHVTKPDPAPLARCLKALGVEAGNAVFIGDARSDAVTARRAGTSYLHPDQLRTG